MPIQCTPSKLLQVDALPHAHALYVVDVNGDGFGLDVLLERQLLATQAFERGVGLRSTLRQTTHVIRQLAHFRHQARLRGEENKRETI